MTRQEEQERAVRDYRVAIEKSVENDEQMGRYGHNSNWNETEAARLRERGRELDASESAAKEQYDALKCEESTGLSSDGYRHQVIEEMSRRKILSDSKSHFRELVSTSQGREAMEILLIQAYLLS